MQKNIMLRLFLDKASPYGKDDLYQTIEPFLIKLFRYPKPIKIVKTHVLSFLFDSPEKADFAEKVFETFKRRGHPLLKGISRNF